MRIIAFDTETHLIRPGCPVPKMVCLSCAEYLTEQQASELTTVFLPEHLECWEEPWQHPKAPPPLAPLPRLRVGLLNAWAGILALRGWLLDPNVLIVGHNVRFDLAVCIMMDPDLLPLVFQAYEEGRIHDTMVRQQLCDIATGELKYHEDEETGEVTHSDYHLDRLAYRLLRRWIAKEDTWRLKYALLDGVPLTAWPLEAARYAMLDAIVTLDLHVKQDELAGGPIPNSAEQHKADFALYLMSLWGVRTDPEAVADLKAKLEVEYAEKMTALRPSGLIRHEAARVNRKGVTVPEKNTRDMKAIRARVEAAYTAQGLTIPQTDNEENPQTSTDRKTLKNSGDPDLILLADIGKVAKLLQTYVPILESGTQHPINCRYNVLVETGRSSCSSPNLQNPPR
jgi:DNA polymerase I